LPTQRVGQALALADKIDTLVGIFAIEQRPTGTKDPFGLRRAALGVLRILLEGKLDLDLVGLLEFAAQGQPVHREGVALEVYDFLADRLRGLLLERSGISADMIDAVLALRRLSPLDVDTRLTALKDFLLLPDAGVLAALNKRIVNILRKAPPADVLVRPELFTEEAERRLHAMQTTLEEPVRHAIGEQRYADALGALTQLRPGVDAFFDEVMVMDENLERRHNRLALLRAVQGLLGGVADLSRLPG
jgi:glycyl-tRNA synthetase beta chain